MPSGRLKQDDKKFASSLSNSARLYQKKTKMLKIGDMAQYEEPEEERGMREAGRDRGKEGECERPGSKRESE